MFAFELLHSAWDAAALRTAIEASTRRPGAAWVMSNHDFGRLATRFGEPNARAAAMLLLTLPGPAFLFQGDEIGQGEGAPGVRFDRAGRDRHRHPMQWDARGGGFTTGEPWLPLVDPGARNVADQRDDPASMLTLVRELIALRRELERRARADRRGRGRAGLPPRGPRRWRSTPPPSRARRRSEERRASRRRPARSTTECLQRTPLPSVWVKRPARGVSRWQGGGDLHGRHLLARRSRAAGVGLGACAGVGSEEGGSGARAINWYVFNEPGGSYDAAVADCNKEADGKYKINYVKLPTDANQQRELIVRRLAAEDKDIDLIGMDVIWTAELAEAGWILPWEGERRTAATEGKLDGPVKTVEYKGKVYGIPFTSNTQLLWYRKDQVDAPPDDFTWDEMIDDGGRRRAPPSRCRPASTRA